MMTAMTSKKCLWTCTYLVIAAWTKMLCPPQSRRPGVAKLWPARRLALLEQPATARLALLCLRRSCDPSDQSEAKREPEDDCSLGVGHRVGVALLLLRLHGREGVLRDVRLRQGQAPDERGEVRVRAARRLQAGVRGVGPEQLHRRVRAHARVAGVQRAQGVQRLTRALLVLLQRVQLAEVAPGTAVLGVELERHVIVRVAFLHVLVRLPLGLGLVRAVREAQEVVHLGLALGLSPAREPAAGGGGAVRQHAPCVRDQLRVLASLEERMHILELGVAVL